MQMKFMSKYKNNMLKHIILEDTTFGNNKAKLYKFYVAYLMDDIMNHYKRNHQKKRTLGDTWEAFAIAKKKKAEEEQAGKKKRRGNDSDDKDKDLIKKGDFLEHVTQTWGLFEGKRFAEKLEKSEVQVPKYSLGQLMDELDQMYDADQ